MKKRLVLKASTCTLSCPCGAPVIVDGRRPEGVQVCVVCRQSLRIVVAVDPKTNKRRVGILVAPQAVTVKTEAVKVKASSPKTRVKPPAAQGPQEARCSCGTGILVTPQELDALYTCVGCGRCYSAVARLDAKTGHSTPQLIPVETIPLEETPQPAAAPTPKGAEADFASHVIGAQPLRNRDAEVLMSCFCGREIPVDPDQHRQDLTCPGCGLSFQLIMAVEPGTHRPMAVTLPRARGAGRG
jgi:hypothetical protein